MRLKRKIDEYLREWKKSKNKMPLIVKGARQIRKNFIKFQNTTSVYGSDTPVDDKYCISVRGKRRYIIPLTKCNKGICIIKEVSQSAANDINEYFNIKHHKYTGFDFDFKPYGNIKN